MDADPAARARVWLRPATWFWSTVPHPGAAIRARAVHPTETGPPVVLSRPARCGYVLPATALFRVRLVPHVWPRPSRQVVVVGIVWFFLGGLVLVPIVADVGVSLAQARQGGDL